MDAGEQRAIRNQGDCVRGFQLVADLTLAIRRIERGRYRARQRGGVKNDAELPAVRQEDADDFSGTNPAGHQVARHPLHQFGVCAVGETSCRGAGGVNHGDLARVPAAGVENDLVDKLAGGIGKQLGAKSFSQARHMSCGRV